MKHPPPTLDRLIDPLGACLTVESARRVVSLKPDRKLQARVDRLSRKSGAGTLTSAEREEYGQYVAFGTFVSILQSKARRLLAEAGDAG